MAQAVINYSLRLPVDLHDTLVKFARKHRRPVNKEIVARLTKSVQGDRTPKVDDKAA